jgi:hypothetical protein
VSLVAVDSSFGIAWPDGDDGSPGPPAAAAEASAAASAAAASPRAELPSSIEGYAAPSAADVLGSPDPKGLDPLDTFDSRVLVMTLRDMAKNDAHAGWGHSGVTSSAADDEDGATPGARNLAGEPSVGLQHSSPEAEGAMPHTPPVSPAAAATTKAASAAATTPEWLKGASLAVQRPSGSPFESSPVFAPAVSTFPMAASLVPASPVPAVVARAPYLGERAWDCPLCATSNVDIQGDPAAGIPQW